jgi:hypothetical protein
VFWVISVYFNIRNTLPKSGPFLLFQTVYIVIYIYIYVCVCLCVCVLVKYSLLLSVYINVTVQTFSFIASDPFFILLLKFVQDVSTTFDKLQHSVLHVIHSPSLLYNITIGFT